MLSRLYPTKCRYKRLFANPSLRRLNGGSRVKSMVSIHDNNIDTVRKANAIKNKYGYSFYDSLIISAALECGCNTLYSEDMQHDQTIKKA